MRVLVATNPKMGNPFTRTLMEAARKCDPAIEITIDRDAFWTDAAMGYDIIHVMFPHELVQTGKATKSDKLQQRYSELKAKGVKIISTCHNFEPHYANRSQEHDAYALTYQASDMIIHLAQYSLDIFADKYPQAQNVLLLHHVYDSLYADNLTKSEARLALGLDDKKYILCFGIIRDDEEREMLRWLASRLPKDVRLWVPSYYRVNKSRNPIKYTANCLRYLANKLKNSEIKMQRDFVSHEDLPVFFTAADAVLLPRKKILNSGNLPLAFYFGQPVIGPNIGNVGRILAETGNYTFDPSDLGTLTLAAFAALADPWIGAKNKKYASEHMATNRIARRLTEYYRSIVS